MPLCMSSCNGRYHTCSPEELQAIHNATGNALDQLVRSVAVANLKSANDYLQLLALNAKTKSALL